MFNNFNKLTDRPTENQRYRKDNTYVRTKASFKTTCKTSKGPKLSLRTYGGTLVLVLNRARTNHFFQNEMKPKLKNEFWIRFRFL